MDDGLIISIFSVYQIKILNIRIGCHIRKHERHVVVPWTQINTRV